MPGSQKKKVAKVYEVEFWLSATIQDCRVDTSQETASAKCFIMMHWHDNDFLNKIRAEMLVGKSNEYLETDGNMKLENLAQELDEGQPVYGMVDAAPLSFPINIDSMFLNQISAERIDGICWTKYDIRQGVVSVSGCAVEPYSVARYNLSLTFCVPSVPGHAGADRDEGHDPCSDELEHVPVRPAHRPVLLSHTRHDGCSRHLEQVGAVQGVAEVGPGQVPWGQDDSLGRADA